jgi:hypothetical protein
VYYPGFTSKQYSPLSSVVALLSTFPFSASITALLAGEKFYLESDSIEILPHKW